MGSKSYAFGDGGAYDVPPCDKNTQRSAKSIAEDRFDDLVQSGKLFVVEHRARALRLENARRHHRWMSRHSAGAAA